MVEPGQRIGEYVLDTKIGQGSFGEVWRAHHGAWEDQLAAVKIPTDPSFVRNLKREGVSLHKLIHPNIVRAIGYDPTANPPYLMTEFVAGCSLRQFMAMGKPPVAQTIVIMKQLLSGLAYAHERGMVHGDVKPENILVAVDPSGASSARLLPDGAVKVTDFGLGLAALATATGSSRNMMGSERTGVGTMAYIAPEQRDGSAPDVKSDIFACGVVLFELLTGERPAGTELPSELSSDVPRSMDDVFRRSYARRERRYESAQEFLAALEAAAGQLKAPALAPAASSPPAPPQPEKHFGVSAPATAPAPAPQNDDAALITFKEDDAPPVPAAPAPPRKVEATPPAPPPAPAVAAQRPGAPKRPTGPILDQLTRRAVRSGDEVTSVFSKYFKSRPLDEAEGANIRLRLDKWAQSESGVSDFAQRAVFDSIVSTPYYIVTLSTRYSNADKPTVESIEMANPDSSQDCTKALTPADYRPVIWLATNGAFPEAMVDSIPPGPLKSATARLLSAARVRAAHRFIGPQELKITRATAISVRYKYQNQDFAASLIGETLRVHAPRSPVMRMRDDMVKHAIILLESDNIDNGIDELRAIMELPQSNERGSSAYSALRARLAAAYAALAGEVLGSLNILESLEQSDLSETLHPGNDAANNHVRKARLWAKALQLAPGLVIGGIFGMFAGMKRPLNYALIAAAGGALIAALISMIQIGMRMNRTVT
ncbi:MAG TPA: serine/threonine-protein kinase, partial [Tepidisphaeraceae bacterium]|nr:serine/threonine-protein kinase [Tepidisphaeraceae bacterium]